MLLIFLATTAWAAAAVGLGSLLRVPAPPELRVAAAGFAGLVAMTAIGSWVSLVAPVSSTLSAAVATVGLVGAWARRSSLLERRRDLVVAVVVLAALAALTQLPWRQFDTGLYHLQAVKWVRAGAAQPGLAHLHGRLGFNSTWFVLAALLEAPGLAGRSAFVLNALPIAFAAAAVAGALGRLASGAVSLAATFVACAAVPSAWAVVALASLAPDPAVALLVYFSIALWIVALERRDELASAALLATGMAAWALTIKLSAAPLVAGSVLLLALHRRAVDRRSLLRLAAAIAILWTPWLARGVLTSGCLAYPVAATCLPWLPWAVRAEDARTMELVIRAWARAPWTDPHAALPLARWIGPWAVRSAWDPIVQIALPALVAGAAALAWRRVRIRAAFAVALALALSGVAFWFWSAPDPRFGAGFLFAAALLPGALAAAHVTSGVAAEGRPRATRRAGAAFAALVGASFLAGNTWILGLRGPGRNGLLGWPAFPSPRLVTRTTPSGRAFRTPVGTDQCWEAPPPCAPSARWDGVWPRLP